MDHLNARYTANVLSRDTKDNSFAKLPASAWSNAKTDHRDCRLLLFNPTVGEGSVGLRLPIGCTRRSKPDRYRRGSHSNKGMRSNSAGRICLVLCVLSCLASSLATCPTFAAWLRADGWSSLHPVICGGVPCTNLDGFVTVAVASDAASITVTLQVQAAPQSSNIPQFISAGIYGPSGPNEGLVVGSAPLVALAAPAPSLAASTWTSTARFRPANIAQILQYMRTGRAYVSLATDRVPEGELRGQLHAPHCFESQLSPMGPLPASFGVLHPYAFANVMISGSMTDIAVHMQLPTDNARQLSSGITMVKAVDYQGSDLLVIQPTAWDSCVAGSFDGKNQNGLPCSAQIKHTYMSEVNIAESGTTVFHVEHNGNYASWNILCQVSPALITSLTNSSSMFVIKTILSNNDPDIVYEVQGSIQRAIPCRLLMTAHDSLQSMAKNYRSDWITLWSLNEGNPDIRRTLEPRYYAHPLLVLKGETAFAIQKRYGMTEGEMLKVNPSIVDLNNLPVGSFVCIVPNWLTTIAGNGQKICNA